MEMKSDSMVELIEAIKQSAFKASSNELYIPLHGKHTTNPEEEPFDLAEKIRSFFVFDDASQHAPKVMLLMGDTGSGKSVFSQQLHQQLCSAYKSGDPIPLWIPLPELLNPFEGAVEEVLKKKELTELQIAEMKAKERFIFIVDGYDELHQFQNCYVTNGWHDWKAKVLITCRSQALYYQKDPDKYFVPFAGEKRLPWLLRKLYVAPFSSDQIKAYVEADNRLSEDPETKLEYFDKIPGLKELITTPFLLHLTVESLPDILAEQQMSKGNEKITQAKLYDIFIERWFTRQVKKLQTAGQLKDSEQKTKQQFWNYCKKLALQMYAKNISVIPYVLQKASGRLFGKTEKKNSWESFFSADTEVLRSACPLKRMGDHHYGFIHASFVEYFATRAMFEEIQADEVELEDHSPIARSIAAQQSITRSESLRSACDDETVQREDGNDSYETTLGVDRPRGGIHYRVFAKEVNGIRNLADRIVMNETFKRRMIIIVEKSKTSERYAIGAANAITALVRAGVTFNGVDLSRVKISEADISGGYFDCVDFTKADLRNVQMFHVCLRNAKLDGCYVEGLNFGEYSWFKHEEFKGVFDIREDLNRLVMACDDKFVIWNLELNKQIQSWGDTSADIVKYNPEGTLIGSINKGDTKIKLWDVKRRKLLIELCGGTIKVNSFAFSPCGKRLVSCDDRIRLWQIATGIEQASFMGHRKKVSSVQFSPDGKKIVSGSYDKTIRIWTEGHDKELIVLNGSDKIESVEFSSDGLWVVSCDSKNTINVWDLMNGNLIRVLSTDNVINSMSLSPDLKWVAAGCEDKNVRIWEIFTGKEIAILQGHIGSVEKVIFSQNGKRVISACYNGTVRNWDVESGHNFARKRGHLIYTNNVQICANGKYVMTSSRLDSTVRIWEISNGQLKIELENISALSAFNPNGKQVVTIGSKQDSNILKIWDLESKREIATLQGHIGKINSVGYSFDGEKIVSGDSDNTVQVWDVVTGKNLHTLKGHEFPVTNVQFTPCGMSIVSYSPIKKSGIVMDAILNIWDVKSGNLVTQRDAELLHNDNNFLAISPDGKMFMQSDFFKVENFCINELYLKKISSSFHGHEKMVTCGQFSQDGKYAITGSSDGSVRVWDIVDKRCVDVLKFHTEVLSLAYYADNILIVGLYDGSVECRKKCVENIGHRWQLSWSTNIDSATLNLEHLQTSNVVGLSEQNYRLFEQRGAAVELREDTNLDHYLDDIEYFDAEICENDTDGTSYRKRADCKRILSRYIDAIADYDKAIELNKNDESSYFYRGICKYFLGDYDAAQFDIVEESMRTIPRDELCVEFEKVVRNLDKNLLSKFLSMRGYNKNDKNRDDEAIIDFNEAIQLNPDDPFAFGYRALSKSKLDCYEEALLDYDESIRLDSNDCGTFTYRGMCKENLKSHNEAILDYNEAIRLDPKFNLAYSKRGLCKLFLGKYSEAILDLNEALECTDPVKEATTMYSIMAHKALTLFLLDSHQESQNTLTKAQDFYCENRRNFDFENNYLYVSSIIELVEVLLLYASHEIAETDRRFDELNEKFNKNSLKQWCELKTLQGIGIAHLRYYQKALDIFKSVIFMNSKYGTVFVLKERLQHLMAVPTSNKVDTMRRSGSPIHQSLHDNTDQDNASCDDKKMEF